MKIGDTFNNGGSNWIVEKITVDHNRYFRWFKVIAKWSGFGTRPLWANEDYMFFLDRRPLTIDIKQS